MAIVASLLTSNLFTSPSSNSRLPNDPNSQKPIPPPIPIPKYPPPSKKTPKNSNRKPDPNPNPALKSFHRRTKYYKPISSSGQDTTVISTDGSDRSVVIGESGVSYLLPGAPFEFQFSYSETPKVKPIAIREPAFLPFGPPSMPRPWTGKAPLKKKKDKKTPVFDSLNPLPPGTKGVKRVETPGPFAMGKYPKEGKTREEILGEPLTRAEVKKLVKPCLSGNRQVNIGRDGLTHNMLELIHSHWRRQQVCKVRCRGVPTVDMTNVCHHLEEKTRGKIIHRAGGVLYLFRGRNYDYRTRPVYPIMLWKPAAPVYPKLIKEAPEGLTKEEANELRRQGQNLLPICKLAKNGIYVNLVKDVRNAFEGSPLVKINCEGLEPSDYKKIGAKLKDLVPCVLLSFDQEQILMWRGKDWKSMYRDACPSSSAIHPSDSGVTSSLDVTGQPVCVAVRPVAEKAISSPRMITLWKRAIESSKALLLDEIDLGPDALLQKVEEFGGMSQATEYSYPALVVPGKDDTDLATNQYRDVSEDFESNEDDIGDDGDSHSFEEFETSAPSGSLPVDLLAERLNSELGC